MKLEGKAPRINWVKHIKNPGVDHVSGTPCFTVDMDAEVPGCVKILIETAYKINWPAENWVTIPLTLEIAVSRISGKLRLQFSNEREKLGGSYL